MSVNAVTNVPKEAFNPFNSNGSAGFNMPFTGGMNSSIWSMGVPPYTMGGFGMGFGDMGFDSFDSFGYMGGMPSFCGGFPMFGGMGGNYQNYWDQMNEYNQAFTNNQVKQNERMRNTELQYNAPAENVKITAGQLREKIQTNNQDQILDAYNDFKKAVKEMYGGTDEQVSARARTLYEQAYETPLTEDIKNHANGAWYQAFLQSTSDGWGVDDTSAEYNVSQITGQPVGRAQREKKVMGHATGGLVQGGVLGSLAGGILGSMKKCASTGGRYGKAGAIWGAVIGAVVGSWYAATKGNEKFK